MFHAHGLEEQILIKGHATYSNPYIQCSPYQNTINFFHRVGTNNPKLCIEPEKTPNSQRNVEKENQSWGLHNSRLQAQLQNCNHQDSTVQAQKQTHRSVEQNRDPRNGLSTLWWTNLQQSRKECPMEKRQSIQQMVLGKLDSHMKKNETGPFPYTTHKNILKMDKRTQCETGIH